jgi:hypothetical protein
MKNYVTLSENSELTDSSLNFNTELPQNGGNNAINNFLFGEDIWAKFVLEACLDGEFVVVSYIIIKNKITDFSTVDLKNYTILHYVVAYYNMIPKAYEVLDIILKDPNIKYFINIQESDHNNTPLHYAVYTGNNDLVEKLIRYGADTKIKNAENYYIGTETEGSTHSNKDQSENIKNSNVMNKTEDTFSKIKSDDETSFIDDLISQYKSKKYNQLKGGKITISGTRPLNTLTETTNNESIITDSDSPESDSLARSIINQGEKIHERVVVKISELLNVPIEIAKFYKAALYASVKKNHPELNNYDRAIEMEKITTIENLKNIDIVTVKKEIEEKRLLSDNKNIVKNTDNKDIKNKDNKNKDTKNKDKIKSIDKKKLQRSKSKKSNKSNKSNKSKKSKKYSRK